MRRLSIVIVFGVFVSLAVVPAAQAVPGDTPFTGTWVGRDPAPPDGDGSALLLIVGSGPRPAITFNDDFGTVCVNEGSPVTEFTSLLKGQVRDDAMRGRFVAASCGPVELDFLVGLRQLWSYRDNGTSDPADDTLWDGSVLWSRG